MLAGVNILLSTRKEARMRLKHIYTIGQKVANLFYVEGNFKCLTAQLAWSSEKTVCI